MISYRGRPEMSITLQFDDGRQVPLEGAVVTIGGESRCTLSLPNDARVRPRHAQLRQVGGRWLIEADAGGAVQVGEAAPARMNWLRAGDEIRLTPSGPTFIFNPAPQTDRAGIESTALVAMVEVGKAPVEIEPTVEPMLPRAGDGSGQSGTHSTRVSIELPGNIGPLLASGLGIGVVVVVAMLLLSPRRSIVQTPAPLKSTVAATMPEMGATPIEPLQGNAPNNTIRVAPVAVVPPHPTWDEIVRIHEEAVVCIGLEYKGHSFPYATGWVARSDRIVTTASVVVQLEPVTKDGFRIVIHHQGKVVPIREVRHHPRYDAAQPTDRASQRFNLGLLIPETDLTPVCLNATPEDWKSISLESQFLPLGVVSSLGENEPYDPLKVQTKRLSIRVTGSDTLPDVAVPLYKVAIDLPKTAEGSPVFNNWGRVVGILAPVGSTVTLVPTSELNVFLD